MAALITFLVFIAGTIFALYFLTRSSIANAEERMSNIMLVIIGLVVAALGGIGLLVSLVWMAVRVSADAAPLAGVLA